MPVDATQVTATERHAVAIKEFEDLNSNLAADPPILGFASISWKYTVQNVSETRERFGKELGACAGAPSV